MLEHIKYLGESFLSLAHHCLKGSSIEYKEMCDENLNPTKEQQIEHEIRLSSNSN